MALASFRCYTYPNFCPNGRSYVTLYQLQVCGLCGAVWHYHDSIDGGLKARELAAQTKYRADVIVGAEISTRDRHLLALNIERLIRKGQSMADTIQAVHEQRGLAIVAHPLSQWCPSASLETLLALGNHAPDALEVHNASFAGIGSNSRVRVVNTLRFGWTTTAAVMRTTSTRLAAGLRSSWDRQPRI